ncbi:hypothetical protein O1611_g5405 [Lasiodiplodia mahajangana]|uniref:Uncharacterized protein n=1 Tax=Lasiodiplodia mahajangana TaxID=1108764 RepID=A0ACC2JLD0_9PEZI|nr:hypothetical protein O1611_g5405 [Lasiodiplodia mahajangana]
MTVVQHLDDVPSSPSEQGPSSTRVENSGLDAASNSGGGPVRFPRREHSLNFRGTGYSASQGWNPKHAQDRSPTLPPISPSYSLSTHPTHRHNTGGNPYDHHYYQSPSPTATSPTYFASNSNYDPRLRPGYLRDSPASSQRIPSPPTSRWDSLPKISGPIYKPATSAPSSPVALTFSSESSDLTNEPHRSIDSVASETRDKFPALPAVRSNTTENPMPVENFSRPRVLSIKQLNHDSPRLRSPTQPQPEPSQQDSTNAAAGSWPRSRGPSISSNKSAPTFTSLAVRPSYDPHNRDIPRGRARQPHPPPIRPPISYVRAESSGPSFTRDPIPRMASLPNDELRSSFRSQISASTAQGTLTTERSSVLTKSSSVTSVYGNVDDSLSVDDVLGLYDKGFDDDSAPEDNDQTESPPHTAMSASSKGGTIELDVSPEVATNIIEPLPIFGNEGTIIRDSAAIFRISNHKTTTSESSAGGREYSDAPEAALPDPVEDFTPSPPGPP